MNTPEVDSRARGQAALRVKKVSGAKVYMYQYTKVQPADESVWLSVGSSDREHTFTDLESGVRYWFRVVAIGINKQVAFSPVVTWLIQ